MTPRRRRLRAWAVVALLLAVVVCFVVRAEWERRARARCLNNLFQLGQIFAMESQERPRESWNHSGPSLLLSWRKDRSPLLRDEKVFVCPKDDLAQVPETDDERRAWDDVDLAHPLRSLCSYAGRDFAAFPLPATGSLRSEPIAACLRHRGIVILAFAEGDAQFVKLDELGLASDDEKIVGPASKSPLLRVLRFGDGSVR